MKLIRTLLILCSVNGTGRIARWDGSQWHALGSGIDDGTVYTIAISGSTIYVGGSFTNRIARWDGAQWHAVPGGTSIVNWIRAIAISGDNVYIGGNFYLFTTIETRFLARWDGSRWHAVGGANALGGVSSPSVNTLAIDGDNLYVGGNFINAGGNPYADYVARLTQFRVYLPLAVR